MSAMLRMPSVAWMELTLMVPASLLRPLMVEEESAVMRSATAVVERVTGKFSFL